MKSLALLAEPGSFRDREGRIFYRDGEVYRALSPAAAADWRALQETGFFARAQAAGWVIETHDADPALLPESEDQAQRWQAALHHRRIPFVSYPYEWSFGMLRDAALLQLDLLLAALAEDFVLKDSSPYNVQWLGHQPVFIDLPSFQRLPRGEPWIGYLQFCQLYLYPLLLTAYRDVPHHAWLRGSLDGIPPETCAALFSVRDRLRPGVFTHVHLQSWLRRLHASRSTSARDEARRSGFPRALIKRNAASLRRLVAGLRWRRARSEWSEYAEEHSYAPADLQAKERFVERAAATRRFTRLWDLGCNTGRFTRIAARFCDHAVAMDADPLAIERLYLELQAGSGTANVLPLVNNLADPSPDQGWRGLERRSLAARGRPDLTLALALIHHLVIGANVPMAELVAWLADLGSHLVIEFPTRADGMVKRLLLNKDDRYADYEQGFFERCLERHLRVVEREALPSGTRWLYFCAPP